MIGVRFLIMAVDKSDPDPEQDKLCYKQGDIVVVKPAGFLWGKAERMPLFLRVDVTDMSMYEAECLADSLVSVDGTLLARRKFFCAQNIKMENQAAFNQCVANNEVYVTTKADLIGYALQERC